MNKWITASSPCIWILYVYLASTHPISNKSWLSITFSQVHVIFNKYLHFVLFRTIYYYQVVVWCMRPYFRRHITLIVNTTSQYDVLWIHLLRHTDCVNAFLLVATNPEDYAAKLWYNVIFYRNYFHNVNISNELLFCF
jgi:hypothetical protein